MSCSKLLVFEAITFVAEAHYGHYRKGSTVPYVAHLMSVARILASSGCNETVVAAGILHDVLEDTPVTETTLREAFGDEVTDIVVGASEDEKLNPEPGRQYTWKERKESTLRYLGEKATSDQLVVACADKLDNLRSTRLDMETLGEKVWERFNAGAAQQQWYYKSLLAIFQEKLEHSSTPLQKITADLKKELELIFSK